jgi:hypothetical protein
MVAVEHAVVLAIASAIVVGAAKAPVGVSPYPPSLQWVLGVGVAAPLQTTPSDS